MKKRNVWLIVGIVVLIIIIGFIYTNNNQKKENTIKIGVIAPLTGPLAEYGIAFKNGIELLNSENGNPNITYIFEDNKWDSKEAISAFNKLIQIEGVDIVLNWGTPTSEAIAPIVKDTVPFIAITTEPPITDLSSYIIRGGFNQPKDYIEKDWKYLRAHNVKKIAILKTDIVYLNSLLNELQKAKNSDESIVLVDNFNFEDNDFKTSIAKLSKDKYDAVGVFLTSGQISTFYKQSKELGISLPITFGSDFFESQSEIDGAQGLMNGAVFANTGVTIEFMDKYVSTFRGSSQIASAGYGYDLAKILNTVVDYKDKDTILNSLKSVKNFSGVEGTISYAEPSGDRYFTKSTYLKIIENNSIRILN
ncbi:ABC transporter substrate-binding protein [Candidatus Pacearchaeota archaeon]|nr:ABC transporter substrate-binding protein [Candidatus Pacearchaeota archaeon]